MAAVRPNMIHRQIMQRLLSGEWKTLTQLGVMAGEGLSTQMNNRGWIERRSVGRDHETRIASDGREAQRATIPHEPPRSLPAG
jgi:hypothetical protein